MRPSRLLPYLGAVTLLVPRPALAWVQQPTIPAPPPFRQTALDLAVRVDYDSETVDGVATLTLENWTAAPAGSVTLLLNRLMTAAAVTDSAGAPLPFTQDVVRFVDSPKRQVCLVTIDLPRPVSPGGSVTVAVRYGGFLTGYTETGSLYIRDHVDTAFTILRTDALAFPDVGVASRRANRAVPWGDFAFHAAVTVPAGFTVATGGVLVERRPVDGAVTWEYRSTGPVPFLNIAIARYVRREGGGVTVYAFPADSDGAARVAERSAAAVGRLTQWFGPLPTAPRFTVIEIPDGWGSQASLTGGIIQTASAFRDPAQLRQLYHETSHFWNPPDRATPSPRMNEGLASYLERRLARDLDGRGGLDSLLETRADWVRTIAADRPRLATVPMAAYGDSGMTDFSYSVGQLFFAVLDRALGAAQFERLWGEWLARSWERGATDREFAVWASARPAGRVDVRRAFQEWFFSTRWLERLRAGESLAAIAASYRR